MKGKGGKIFVLVGRAGCWRRGPWEPDCQRTSDSVVRLIEAESLAKAISMAREAGYDLQSREWAIRQASKSETEWARSALKADWIK